MSEKFKAAEASRRQDLNAIGKISSEYNSIP